MNDRYTDKLAKYILLAAGIAIVGAICWYFRSVLIYILAAVVVSLIGKPMMRQLQKIEIKGHKAPDWFLAAFTLITLLLQDTRKSLQMIMQWHVRLRLGRSISVASGRMSRWFQ